jgi:hypothetical protein
MIGSHIKMVGRVAPRAPCCEVKSASFWNRCLRRARRRRALPVGGPGNLFRQSP